MYVTQGVIGLSSGVGGTCEQPIKAMHVLDVLSEAKLTGFFSDVFTTASYQHHLICSILNHSISLTKHQ